MRTDRYQVLAVCGRGAVPAQRLILTLVLWDQLGTARLALVRFNIRRAVVRQSNDGQNCPALDVECERHGLGGKHRPGYIHRWRCDHRKMPSHRHGDSNWPLEPVPPSTFL